MIKFSDFFKRKCGEKLDDNQLMPKILACYDIKSKSFLEPFIAPSENFAIRSIQQLFIDKKSCMITNFPEDYSLWCLADFNPNNGNVISNLYQVTTVFDISKNYEKVTNTVELFPINNDDVSSVVKSDEILESEVKVEKV